ncbi:ABC transporter ATP-binding protein, partial [Pseudomonadota bacterium]
VLNKNEGSVKVFGIDIDKDHDRAKKMIGVVPQEFNFNIFEKVIDIVTQQAGYFGIPRKEALKRADEVLRPLGLWEERFKKSMALSGGMKRRLMIARALLHKPKLLILDEPTAGVDVELRHDMWEYLRELNQQGTTILLTTHYLEEAEQMCKNVAIINDGEIVKNDSVKNLLNCMETQTYVFSVNKIVDGELNGFDLRIIDDSTVEVDLGLNQSLHDFMSALKENGITVQALRPKKNRLEQLFLNIIKAEDECN